VPSPFCRFHQRNRRSVTKGRDESLKAREKEKSMHMIRIGARLRVNSAEYVIYFLFSGDDASNRICFSNSVCMGNSESPVGKRFMLNMKDRISAFCWRLIRPGRSAGMLLRIRSNKSPTVRPYQLDENSPPVNGGADSPPVRAVPWQDAQFCAYNFSPRVDCAAVNAPSQTERESFCAQSIQPAANRMNFDFVTLFFGQSISYIFAGVGSAAHSNDNILLAID
jgi:hypothetical protein